MVTIFETELAESIKGNWNQFLSDIFNGEIKWVKSNNGKSFVCLDIEYIKFFVQNITYRVKVKKDEKKFIGTIENFWFVESSDTVEDLKVELTHQLKEFAIHYFNDLELYKYTPDFRFMFPLIINVIILEHVEEISKSFEIVEI